MNSVCFVDTNIQGQSKNLQFSRIDFDCERPSRKEKASVNTV